MVAQPPLYDSGQDATLGGGRVVDFTGSVGRFARPVQTAEAGYAAVDALVALLILSVTLIMSFQALQQAKRLSQATLEVRQAQTLATWLMETGPRSYEVATGSSGAFTWRLSTDATGAARPIEVCHREVTLTSSVSGRIFKAATLEVCPALGAA